MNISRRELMLGVSAVAIITSVETADAWIRGAAITSFNGKPLQTNTFAPSFGHDYPWLNLIKGGQNWSFNGSFSGSVTPDILDANGYLINGSAGAGQGIFTRFSGPSQQERSGLYVYKWTGNGNVGSGSTGSTVFSIQIIGASQSGGVQTYQLAANPSPAFVAGMAIAISGLSGGTWGGANATVQIQAINSVSNTISINTGTTFTGSPVISGSSAATCVPTTTVSNGSGLTGFGRYVVQPQSTGSSGGNLGQDFYCSINSIASSSDYPHDIVVCHINDEAKLAAGKIFSDVALQIYGAFGCIRFLGWQYGFSNFTNISTWSTRKPVSYVSYAADQLRSDLYASTCTQTVDATGCTYNVSLPTTWPGLTDKATIHFNPDKSQNAAITALASDGAGNTIVTFSTGGVNTSFVEGGTIVVANVANGTGAGWTGCNGTFAIVAGSVGAGTIKIPVNSSTFTGVPSLTGAIVRHNLAYIKVGTTTAVAVASYNLSTFNTNIVAGTFASLVTAIYDAPLNGWLYCGGSASTSIWLANFVPPEIMFELSIQCGAHPYFVTPQYSISNPTDFMPQLMLMAQTYLSRAPWMVPRYEPPNELWNSGFPQTNYAYQQAAIFSGWGGSTDADNWYGMVASFLGQMAKAVYGTYPGASSNYGVIAAIQSASARLQSVIPASRLESTKFVASGPTPPSVSVAGFGTISFSRLRAAGTAAQGGTTATNYITHVVPATYWRPNCVDSSTSGYPTTEPALYNAFNGATISYATINAGVLTVSADPSSGSGIGFGTIISDGTMSLIGPDGTVLATITSQLSGTAGGVGTYQLSNGTLTIATPNAYYAGVDLTAPNTLEGFAYDAIFNGTISGSTLTINSYTSGWIGAITGSSLVAYIYGGTIAQGTQGSVQITGGSYPTFTLSGSPGNQTANFKAGNQVSLDGAMNIYVNAANFALAHNVVKMQAYEGDYSPDYPNNSPKSLAGQLRRQSKLSTTIKSHTIANWDNFRGRGGTPLPIGITAEFPSVFLPVGPYPSSNVWSVNEDGFNQTSPRWQAILDYQ